MLANLKVFGSPGGGGGVQGGAGWTSRGIRACRTVGWLRRAWGTGVGPRVDCRGGSGAVDPSRDRASLTRRGSGEGGSGRAGAGIVHGDRGCGSIPLAGGRVNATGHGPSGRQWPLVPCSRAGRDRAGRWARCPPILRGIPRHLGYA